MKYNLFKRKKRIGSGYVWYYTYTDPDTGVRKQKRCKGCQTMREAKEYIDRLPKAPRQAVTFGEYASDFYDKGGRWDSERERRGYPVKGSTLKNKALMLEKIIMPKWGNKDITEIRRREVMAWVDSLDYANDSKNHIISAMREPMKAAYLDGVLEADTLADIPLYKPNPKEKETLTAEEIAALFPLSLEKLKDMYGDGVGVCALVMVSSGIRIGEAIALRWECYDTAVGGIKIIEQWSTYSGFTPPKKKEFRSIILPEKVCSLLNELKKESCGENDFIFKKNRKNLSKNDFKKMTEKIEAQTGKHITPHCLRHTYNTRMRNILLAKGVSENVLRAFTGHRSESMSDHYDHPILDSKMKALSEYKDAVNLLFSE